MKRELIYATSFARRAKRLLKRRPDVANDVEAALTLLSDDAFDPRLSSHKLRGPLEDRWACSVSYDLRIVFRFVEVEAAEAVLLLSIGTHDDVY